MANLDCSELTGTLNAMCVALFDAANPLTNTCNGLSYIGAGDVCLNYTSPDEKMAGQLGNQANLNTGNTTWMLVATAFVMIMTPGVGLFYGGLSGQTNVSNTILMCFVTMCVVSIQWFLFGYSFAFGPGNNAFGSFQYGALTGIGGAPSGASGIAIPHLIFVAFQCMFAQITPALIAGGVIGRMRFSRFILFVLIWTTVVYDPLAHWLWSIDVDDTGAAAANGWLNALGAADFAGGTVIHISSGFAALAAALVLGKRREYGTPLKPHNVPMVVIGASLLWFGWFGFNAGSAGGAAGFSYNDFLNNLASFAFINSHLAAGVASFSWMVCEKLFDGTPTAAGAASGIVAGLVAITPGCGYVLPWAAVLFGLFVSPFCYAACKLRNKLQIDDTLDSWAVHGIGGMVGAFMTGIFATPDVNAPYTGAIYGRPVMLGYQMAAITVASSFSFTLTLVMLIIMKKTIGIRVSEEVEDEGLDMSEHGGKAYDTGEIMPDKEPAIGFTITPAATIETENPVASREASDAKHKKEEDV